MRRIDHIVVAVRELERASELYCRLGFHVGARNQHPWGTENRLIQFGSSFIELITVGDAAHRIGAHQQRRFNFGAFVREYLEEHEGIAMLALSSGDAVSDAARFAEQGIGDFEPFYFERKAIRPDGAETKVAFTLAFARDPAASEIGFFVCQQRFPENFWNPTFQQHANLATDIAAVTLATSNPEGHAEFLTQFSDAERQSCANGNLRFALAGGRIEVDSGEARPQSTRLPSLASVSVRVTDMARLMGLLRDEEIPFRTSQESVVLAPGLLFGVELRFETTAGI